VRRRAGTIAAATTLKDTGDQLTAMVVVVVRMRIVAPVVQRPLEELLSHDAEDEEKERGQTHDVAQRGNCGKDSRDEHGHARHEA
jgi:hypothetical protein